MPSLKSRGKIIAAIDLKDRKRRARLKRDSRQHYHIEIGLKSSKGPKALKNVERSLNLHRDEMKAISTLFLTGFIYL